MYSESDTVNFRQLIGISCSWHIFDISLVVGASCYSLLAVRIKCQNSQLTTFQHKVLTCLWNCAHKHSVHHFLSQNAVLWATVLGTTQPTVMCRIHYRKHNSAFVPNAKYRKKSFYLIVSEESVISVAHRSSMLLSIRKQACFKQKVAFSLAFVHCVCL